MLLSQAIETAEALCPEQSSQGRVRRAEACLACRRIAYFCVNRHSLTFSPRVQMLNHRHMGSRYIEVFVSTEAEAPSSHPSKRGTARGLAVCTPFVRPPQRQTQLPKRRREARHGCRTAPLLRCVCILRKMRFGGGVGLKSTSACWPICGNFAPGERARAPAWVAFQRDRGKCADVLPGEPARRVV